MFTSDQLRIVQQTRIVDDGLYDWFVVFIAQLLFVHEAVDLICWFLSLLQWNTATGRQVRVRRLLLLSVYRMMMKWLMERRMLMVAWDRVAVQNLVQNVGLVRLLAVRRGAVGRTVVDNAVLRQQRLLFVRQVRGCSGNGLILVQKSRWVVVQNCTIHICTSE